MGVQQCRIWAAGRRLGGIVRKIYMRRSICVVLHMGLVAASGFAPRGYIAERFLLFVAGCESLVPDSAGAFRRATAFGVGDRRNHQRADQLRNGIESWPFRHGGVRPSGLGAATGDSTGVVGSGVRVRLAERRKGCGAVTESRRRSALR